MLLQPITRGNHSNKQLSQHLLNIGGYYYMDPAATLRSMLRALHVVRSVLATNGHVYIVNSNPMMRPLMTEAAHSCLNPNVWFMSSRWTPGALTNYEVRPGVFGSV